MINNLQIAAGIPLKNFSITFYNRPIGNDPFVIAHKTYSKIRYYRVFELPFKFFKLLVFSSILLVI